MFITVSFRGSEATEKSSEAQLRSLWSLDSSLRSE